MCVFVLFCCIDSSRGGGGVGVSHWLGLSHVEGQLPGALVRYNCKSAGGVGGGGGGGGECMLASHCHLFCARVSAVDL